MERRSVLFVVPRFHTNKAQAVSALHDAGHRVTVFTTTRDVGEDHSVVTPIVFRDEDALRDLPRHLQDAAPDIVFFRLCNPLSDAILPHLRRMRPRPRIYRYKSGAPPLEMKIGAVFERLLRREPRGVVSPALPPDTDTWLGCVRSLPWPVEVAPPSDLPDTPLSLLCVAKLNQPRKNVDAVIRAARALDCDWRLTLVGSASVLRYPTLSTMTAIETHAAEDRRITVLRDVPYADMTDIFRRHAICVLAAEKEPLGTAPLEAMGQGCIPVVSETSGAAVYVQDGIDGFHVPPGDVAAMSRVFAALAGDPEKLKAMRGAAYRGAARKLSKDRFLDVFATL